MSRKKVLVLCPSSKDKQELMQPRIQEQYDVMFHQYDAEHIVCDNVGWITETFDPEHIITEAVGLCRRHDIEGIFATKDYPATVFASIVAHQLGLIAPDIHAVLTCQHKYYARCKQKELVPEATPQFELLELSDDAKPVKLSYPFFIKPVKAFFSVYADYIADEKALTHYLRNSRMPDTFLYQFDWFIKSYTDFEKDAHYALAEEYLVGDQVTLEGCMFNNHCMLLGVVDSVMFPGTISFKRFEYPSALSEVVQQRMVTIAETCMRGVGFDNGFFNVEFMYNATADTIHIIEINPRMSSQFADLFEKVDGTNTYEHLLRLVTGEQPIITKKQGRHAVAASFVLRMFNDAYVVSVPTDDDVAAIKREFPDVCIDIFARPGMRLSDERQDGKSYRYGLVHVGGADRENLFERFKYIKARLPFVFSYF